MQQEAMAAGHALPDAVSRAPEWGGLKFGLGGDLYLVVELADVVDVMDCPAITPVPGTQPWIMGVCNVRGRPFSVVDLGLFLGVSPRASPREGKLLVVDHEDLDCTLHVPRIFGLSSFTLARENGDGAPAGELLKPYVVRTLDEAGRTWHVLSLQRILTDERFLGVASSA